MNVQLIVESGSFGTFAAAPTDLPDSAGEASPPQENKSNFITEKELKDNRMQGEGKS